MPLAPLPVPQWIDTLPALQKLAEELGRWPGIAVDTESNSLHAFQEQVCLIQFSTPENDYLVDPLALADLTPLVPIFDNPRIEKVFHAIEYDLICLKRSFGIQVANIFDTMQAARILGCKQVGLDAILLEKLGIQLYKKYQKADWGERPLSPEMLNYARLDTRHLLALRDCLRSDLEKNGRWELAQEEFVRLAQGNENCKAEIHAWQRVKGTQKFSDRQLTILQELCAWRELRAQQMDRPVFKVIDNNRLVAIVQAMPKTPKDLEAIGLTARQIGPYGKDILKAILRGSQNNPVRRTHTARPAQAYLDRLEALSEWRKLAAQRMGIESDLILPKCWMNAIAEKNSKTVEELAALMPQSPWRLGNYGAEILGILTKITSGEK